MAEGGKRRRRARIGGYATDLSIEPVREDLTCAICTDILRDPMMVNPEKCGHTYCRSCIEQHLRRSRTCPDCREHIPEDGGIVKAPPILQRMVRGIRVRCIFAFGDQNDFPHGEPCGWEGELGNFDGHVEGKCVYGEDECAQGCGEFIARILAVRHEEKNCSQTEVICVFPDCGAKVKRCQLEDHMTASPAVHFIPLLGMVTRLKEKVEMLEQKETDQQATIDALQGDVAIYKQNEEALKATVAALDEEHKQKETALQATVQAHNQSLETQQQGMAALEKKVMAVLEKKVMVLEQSDVAIKAAVQKQEQNQAQKEAALSAKLNALQEKVTTQERSAATPEAGPAARSMAATPRVVDENLLRSLADQIFQATPSGSHHFKNEQCGNIYGFGKSWSFRIDFGCALEVGKPLEITISMWRTESLKSIIFICRSSRGMCEELETSDLVGKSRVRLMVSKDGVLSAYDLSGSGTPVSVSGWPKDGQTMASIRVNPYSFGNYQLTLP